MVKKIIHNAIPLLLLVSALLLYQWSSDAAVIISTVALVIFGIASGIAISNLLEVFKDGGKK